MITACIFINLRKAFDSHIILYNHTFLIDKLEKAGFKGNCQIVKVLHKQSPAVCFFLQANDKVLQLIAKTTKCMVFDTKGKTILIFQDFL